MDKFDENMDKLAKSIEERSDRIIEEAQQKSAGSTHGMILGNLGTFLLFNLFVLGMAALTLFFGNKAYQVTKNGETTSGTVVKLAESNTEDGCCVYSPVVEYEVDGRGYVFESMNASDPPSYRIGQQIEVIYDPASPSKGAINSWTELWLVPGILGLTTLILAVVFNWIAISKISKGEPITDSDD